MIRRAIEDQIPASPNLIAFVKMETLADEQNRFGVLEESLTSSRDVLVGRISLKL